MILLPLLAIAALVLDVEFASAREVLCSLEHTALDLEVGDSFDIHSPNYPHHYPDNEDCGWNVKAIGTEDLRISCSNFKMEKPNSNGTCVDFLQIKHEKYCGHKGSLDVEISAGKITHLKFVSDKNKSESGFHCTVTALFYEGRKYLSSFVVTNIHYNDGLADNSSLEFDYAKNKIYNTVGADLQETMGAKLLQFEVIGFEDGSLGLNRMQRPAKVSIEILADIDPSPALKHQEVVIDETLNTTYDNDCICNWDTDLAKNRPMIINWKNEIVHPVQIGEQHEKKILQVRVEPEKPLLFTCPGILDSNNTKNVLSSIQGGPSNVEVVCKEGTIQVNGKKQLKVCYDFKKEQTLWTWHFLYGKSLSAQGKIDTSGYWKFNGKTDLEESYEVKNQRDFFFDKKIELQKFKLCIGQQYFAKGHMSPAADFITKPEKDASYHYMNAVPQWQAFNNGNWKRIEEGMRTLAKPTTVTSNDGKTLEIISGGFGVLEMEKQVDKVMVSICLTKDAQNKCILPAPAFTWKLVYERSSKRAVAFIVTNNPNTYLLFEESINIGSAEVTDLCDTPNYRNMFWSPPVNGKPGEYVNRTPEKGYTYCLSYVDLTKIVKYVPKLVVIPGDDGLLHK